MVRARPGVLAWTVPLGLLVCLGCSGAQGSAGSVPATLTQAGEAGATGNLGVTAPGAATASPADSAKAAMNPAASIADGAHASPRDATASTRVMVTLAPAPPPIWDQITLDLERTYRLRTVFAWSMQSLGERCIVFEAPADRSVEALLHRLASDPRVELAQPVQRFTTQDSHTAGLQVPLQHSALALRLAQAHRWATGRGVRVAVIDTGVDVEHPELRGRIAKTGNFVEIGRGDPSFNSDIHGTAVAGVIAAALNSAIGLVGVAPQAQVFALKACWQERPGAREAVCDSYTLSKAIDFAIIHGAQVLNFSLAGPEDPMIAKLVASALGRGIVVVAADGPDAARSFPASQPGVLGVAGSDDLQGGLRFPTRRLAAGTLAAPGVDILTTVPHGHYDFFSGASFAAAQVSGAAALLLEREPKMTPHQVAALFHRTGHPIPAAPGDPTSIDQIDACAALAASLGSGCS
ncbi:MAG TPA: S8 family serine peptidase [Thermoanaerobaculia bacterium]|jgi:subtilisin family serine protease|nr:S8 family serine peptidase [Thermoanaerobaculia bacterium]